MLDREPSGGAATSDRSARQTSSYRASSRHAGGPRPALPPGGVTEQAECVVRKEGLVGTRVPQPSLAGVVGT